MFIHKTKIRVRYAETDQMGYAYYGNYATYFEVARVEALRSLNFSYKQLEKDGVMLPVLEFGIKYFKPGFYDDELTIKTMISELPSARIKFDYETYNSEGVLLNKANTTLVFVSVKTKRPTSAPQYLLDKLKPMID
jgi:acyl-CoA thioester hydrolase|tara:strand:+ start:226 stop:633 length:408 start_codon:yes stop_codon:yes gene_type:complete